MEPKRSKKAKLGLYTGQKSIVPSGRWGSTGFRLTFRLQTHRLKRPAGRFLIARTLPDTIDPRNTLSILFLRLGGHKPNISGTGKI